jgi:DNA-binding transcriptional MocR family regulator
MTRTTKPAYQRAAAMIRTLIAEGQLKPGDPAPSAAQLARMTGLAAATCTRSIKLLLREGTLIPGASPAARPRIPGTGTLASGRSQRQSQGPMAVDSPGLPRRRRCPARWFYPLRPWQVHDHVNKTSNKMPNLLDHSAAVRERIPVGPGRRPSRAKRARLRPAAVRAGRGPGCTVPPAIFRV